MLDEIEDFNALTIEDYLSVIENGQIIGDKFTCNINKCEMKLINKIEGLNRLILELIISFEIHSETSLFSINEIMGNIGSMESLSNESQIIFSSIINNDIKKDVVICTFITSGIIK